VARANLATAGLDVVVELIEGRAAETLATLPGPFDLVFLDADRPSYPSYLELVVPKLRPGGILVADNVTSHAAELHDYLHRVKSHPQLFSVTVPIGNGEEIALKLDDRRMAVPSPRTRPPSGLRSPVSCTIYVNPFHFIDLFADLASARVGV
jgi:spermidine synthase